MLRLMDPQNLFAGGDSSLIGEPSAPYDVERALASQLEESAISNLGIATGLANFGLLARTTGPAITVAAIGVQFKSAYDDVQAAPPTVEKLSVTENKKHRKSYGETSEKTIDLSALFENVLDTKLKSMIECAIQNFANLMRL